MPIILTPTYQPSVATVTFASMVPDISAFLPGCPSLVIERTVRKMAIDLCQRAKVWEGELVPITLVPGTHEYDMVPESDFAEATDVVDAYLLKSDGTKVSLPYRPLLQVRRLRPSWPQDDVGQPQMVSTGDRFRLLVAPVPDEAADVYVRAKLRPTDTAVSWEKPMYDEFKRALFHGTLHELMLMPDRSWFDEKQGINHGKQWTYLLNSARYRAESNFNSGALAVEQRPFA